MTDKQICDRIKGVLSASMMPMEMELECVRFLERCQNDGWVPVAERLPPDNIPSKNYLCYWNGCIRVCKYWRTRKCFEFTGRVVKVTHWMPLPEPPGKDGA